MKNMKYTVLIFLTTLLFSCNSSAENPVAEVKYNIAIPIYGNSWLINNPAGSEKVIGEEGIVNWENSNDRIRTFFRIEKPGKVHLALKTRVLLGKSKLKITFGNESKIIDLANSNFETVAIGEFVIDQPGYYYLELQGMEKSAGEFARVSELLIGGDLTPADLFFVREEFYWGRRGPSVHLGFEVPGSVGEVRWFYNDITVPEGNDVIGSYFMANGFGEGYFGIQVNSETERRILFSVWSPYTTDDPNSIPDDYKIRLLRKGENVRSGEFGNEGSGGQSYRKYLWKAGTTYRFLLKGEPSENNSTDYTAYFFAPEIGQWELMASFRRPHTSTSLKRLHSFLENFIPEMGCVTRQVVYSNQWVCNTEGKWTELTRAKFTADATAHKQSRLDYAGGAKEQLFFLKNCGFFSERVAYDSWFDRLPTGKVPEIDFSKLP